MRLAAPIVIAFAIVVASPHRTEACSCMSSGPVCQAFWNTAAVFDATVVGIERIGRDQLIGNRTIAVPEKLVTLDVRQAWKGAGVAPGPLQVLTAENGGACGFDFKPGHRYLVFATAGTDGGLRVSLCSATREFDGTGEANAFLQSLTQPESGGRAFGSVTLSQRVFGPDGAPSTETPMELRVKLSGDGQNRTVVSTGGKYEFTGLAPGRYEVDISLPDGYSAWSSMRPIEIPNRRACSQNDFGVSPAGRIVGRLLDASGRAVRNVRVELTGATTRPQRAYGIESMSTQSDPDGSFALTGVAPGRYMLGINLNDLPSQWNPYARNVYPGAGQPPQVLELSLGQVVDLGDWTLAPPLPVTSISGVIMWKDGTPAAGAYVAVSDVTGNPVEQPRGAGGSTAGTDGRFSIEVRQGRTYTFIARPDGMGPTAPISAPRIVAGPGLEPVRIVIERDPPR
jgi:hypothetical protein